MRSLGTSFTNKENLLKKIDSLPQGAPWSCHSVTVTGDKKTADGVDMSEELELWFRNPVECVRELIGNPVFRDHMVYAPEKLYEDESEDSQVWNEMNTGEWWWKTQVSSSFSEGRD